MSVIIKFYTYKNEPLFSTEVKIFNEEEWNMVRMRQQNTDIRYEITKDKYFTKCTKSFGKITRISDWKYSNTTKKISVLLEKNYLDILSENPERQKNIFDNVKYIVPTISIHQGFGILYRIIIHNFTPEELRQIKLKEILG